LKTDITFKILPELSHQTLKWFYFYQKFSQPLILANFHQCYRAWPASHWLFDATHCWVTFQEGSVLMYRQRFALCLLFLNEFVFIGPMDLFLNDFSLIRL